jgi:hypothetical protein
MFKNLGSLRLTKVALLAIIAFISGSNYLMAQSEVVQVDAFDKVIVSPHITVVFVQGETESVTIESMTEPREKFNIEVKNNTLSVYLEGAKMTTENKKEKKNGYTMKVPIYKGTVVRAVITYKNLNKLDLRGEEKFVLESPIDTDEFRISIYGESQVYINEVAIKNMMVSIYGESYFEIMKGNTENQKITAYGESTVNVSNVVNENTKLTAYGDGSFRLNVSGKLKVTAYGEATIMYSGDATVNKGIVIGEAKITKTDS